MTINCIRCGKTYQSLKPFKNHLSGRNKCQDKYVVIPKQTYLNDYQNINNLFEETYNELIEQQTGPKYGCEKCGKLLASRTYYYTHKKDYCEPIESGEVIEHNNQLMNNGNVGHNNSHNNITQNNQSQNTNSFNTNNQIGNIVSNNSNNTAVININNFGTEFDITKKLTSRTKQKLLSKPNNVIADMCKIIHVYMPTNRNAYIKDLKDGYGMIYKNGIWESIKMDDLLNELISESACYIYDIVKDDSFMKNETHINRINKHFDRVGEDGKTSATEKINVKHVIYNNKLKIKQTYEKMIGKQVNFSMKPKIDIIEGSEYLD